MKEMYNEEQFDRMIRSTLLEDGREEVPAGLWDGVLSRMAEAEKATGRRRVIRILASVGAAFCCISAAVLLLPTTGDSLPGEPVAVINSPVTSTGNNALTADADDSYKAVPVNVVRDLTVRKDVAVSGGDVHPTTVTDGNDNSTGGFNSGYHTETLTCDGSREPAGTYGTGEDTAGQNGVLKGLTGTDGTAKSITEPDGTVRGNNLTTESFRTNAEGLVFPDDDKEVKNKRIQLSGNVTGAGNVGHHSSYPGRRATNSSFNFGSEGIISEVENTFYMVPISAGIGIQFHFNERWSVGTGINYTFLSRRLNGQYDEGSVENQYVENITNSQHFIGIPISIFCNFAKTERLNFYAHLGTEAQKCVSNRFSFNYAGYDKSLANAVPGLQWSLGAGVGMQVSLADFVYLYLDPNVKYFFKASSQPKSIRTVQPFQLGCDIGLRFDL